MMNEWQMQKQLTREWATHGIEIQGRRHMLVAWEVMTPSWRINDAHRHWGEPSLDFLLADEELNLTVVELKKAVPGVLPAWSVLVQVMLGALRVAETVNREALESAHRSCYSGAHGRLPVSTPQGFSPAHQAFFGLARPCELQRSGVSRAVAAGRFGPSWEAILTEFNALSVDPANLSARLAGINATGSHRKKIERLTGALAARSFGASQWCGNAESVRIAGWD